MLRNDNENRTKWVESTLAMRWTQMIPQNENTLNGLPSTRGSLTIHWLTTPVLPSSRKIQPWITAKPGMKNESHMPKSNHEACGMFVRVISQARSTPTTKPIPILTNTILTVFQSAGHSLGSSNASRQWCSPGLNG